MFLNIFSWAINMINIRLSEASYLGEKKKVCYNVKKLVFSSPSWEDFISVIYKFLITFQCYS